MPRSNAGKAPARKPKGSRSAIAAAERRRIFVEHYLANGGSATEAAIKAGYSPRSANKTAWLLLQEPAIRAQIAERARRVAEIAEMSTERWARELRAIAFADPLDLLDADGKLLPLSKLPPRIRAVLSSIKIKGAEGAEAEVIEMTDALTLELRSRHLRLPAQVTGVPARPATGLDASQDHREGGSLFWKPHTHGGLPGLDDPGVVERHPVFSCRIPSPSRTSRYSSSSNTTSRSDAIGTWACSRRITANPRRT